MIYTFEDYSLDVERQELRREKIMLRSSRKFSICCIISFAIANASSAKTI